MMNGKIDVVLDTILNRCLDSGIEAASSDDGYYLDIAFKNKIEAKLWNSGKYYAWLHRGRIGDYAYENVRPKKKTMRRLIRALATYYLEKP